MQRRLEEYTQMWKRRLEEQGEYLEQMRSIKHDIEAHMIVLQYYMEEEKYEEAKVYLQRMRNQQMKIGNASQIDVGNELINTIIIDYLKRVNDEIEFQYKGELPKKLAMTDYELCVVFSNLMSNAVEACKNLSKIRKTIKLKICVGERLNIYIENPKEWELDEAILGVSSTKENKEEHGYGIRNIKEIVSKYGGEINFKITEERFGVEIILPNV